MANTKISIPSATPICNPQTGVVNQEWRLWFNKLYQRSGGADAPSNTELAQNVENKTTNITKLITNLTSTVNNNSKDINNLELAVDTYTAQINDLDSKISTAENDINNLELNVANNTNTITNLELAVDTNTAQINDLDSQISTAENDINNLELNVANNTTNITNLELAVDTNTAQINDLDSKISTAENDINNLELNVANNTNTITTNSNDINTLKTNTVQSIANLGTGTGIYKDKIANTANFKTLKAGTNITLDNTTNLNEIVINSTGGGGGGLSAGFGDLTITGSLVGSTTGATTYYNVKGGLSWGTGKEVNNSTKITIPDYVSKGSFAYLSPSSVYYVIFDINQNAIKTSQNPTNFSLTSNAKLLWVIETDTTKISKATDYRAMNIFIRPTTEMKVTQLYAGPRGDNFNFSIYYYQNQVADSSLVTALVGKYPRFMRVQTSVLCISEELGYAVGEEAEYTTGDGVIWGKPYRIANSGTITVYQGTQTKIWQSSTNTWVTPTNGKWGLVCRVTLEYH